MVLHTRLEAHLGNRFGDRSKFLNSGADLATEVDDKHAGSVTNVDQALGFECLGGGTNGHAGNSVGGGEIGLAGKPRSGRELTPDDSPAEVFGDFSTERYPRGSSRRTRSCHVGSTHSYPLGALA